MSTLKPDGIEALVKGPVDVLFATLHDLIDVEGQMEKLNKLSDAIVSANESAQKDKRYNSALKLQQLLKQREALRRILPGVRLIQ